MIIDLDPLALAYIRAREKAHNAPPGATGGAGGPHMALHRALAAWQAIGCRVLAVPPETPASDLAGPAARGQAVGHPQAPARSCATCRHNTGRESWTCPTRALTWAEKAGMHATETEWPAGAPACPSFRVRA